jgi:hypothetical protein
MAVTLTRHRTYQVPFHILLGGCLAALGRMRAQVEQQDLERGVIVATVGAGLLAPVTELALTVAPLDEGRASLSVIWRARKLGGDRVILPVFLESVDSLVGKT